MNNVDIKAIIKALRKGLSSCLFTVRASNVSSIRLFAIVIIEYRNVLSDRICVSSMTYPFHINLVKRSGYIHSDNRSCSLKNSVYVHESACHFSNLFILTALSFFSLNFPLLIAQILSR